MYDFKVKEDLCDSVLSCMIAETAHKALSMRSIQRYRCVMLLWSATNAVCLHTCMFHECNIP